MYSVAGSVLVINCPSIKKINGDEFFLVFHMGIIENTEIIENLKRMIQLKTCLVNVTSNQ